MDGCLLRRVSSLGIHLRGNLNGHRGIGPDPRGVSFFHTSERSIRVKSGPMSRDPTSDNTARPKRHHHGRGKGGKEAIVLGDHRSGGAGELCFVWCIRRCCFSMHIEFDVANNTHTRTLCFLGVLHLVRRHNLHLFGKKGRTGWPHRGATVCGKGMYGTW
jgi:hypothetical protein